VVNGDKSKGTDIHTVNQKALLRIAAGVTRDGAKRILYALMYGAGDDKLGWTLKDDIRTAGATPPRVPNRELGGLIRKALSRAMSGFDKLTETVKARAKARGYIKGHDGRHIHVRSQHAALNTLLQGGGAIVMKKALALFHFDVAPARGWEHGVDFAYCANVHDEVQTECRPEIAEELGQAFADCIEKAGQVLGVKCPLAGAFDVGTTWAETH
jgi:DNA polymerase-1